MDYPTSPPSRPASFADAEPDESLPSLSPPPAETWRPYVPVPAKFAIACTIATAWMVLSVWLSTRWLDDLSDVIGRPLAIFVIAFIAYVPGFMNAFLIATLSMDRRPRRAIPMRYPPVSVLVACYNEARNIEATILSLAAQDYPGAMEVLILDDGSTDGTPDIVDSAIGVIGAGGGHRFTLVRSEVNRGKSHVLNRGLALASNELLVTVDADTWVYEDAVQRIVERYLSDPPGTRAVAGGVLVRNSRESWLTRVQEWDYFHGIAAVKRAQSMYHGTLVAQGAFSLYHRETVSQLGGWPACVGEDIVLSWAMLKEGWRIGYCEDALVFTDVPGTLRQFAGQRKRWSRGLIEAFKAHPQLLVRARLSMLFIWWNVLFLPLDLVYTLAFIPGVVLALFGHYYIAGVMTLLVLPLALLWNAFIFWVQQRMFKRQDLQVRRNVGGFVMYALGYAMILQPISLWGYCSEILGLRKRWDTK